MLAIPLFHGRAHAHRSCAYPPLLGCFLVFAMSGCASNGGRAAREPTRVDASRFDSPVSRPMPSDAAAGLERDVLDRPSYVRAVLERNPTVESARQGVRAASSRVAQSGPIEDPMIDLGLAPLSIGSATARVGYEIGISQKLPWFGKRGLEVAAATAEADAAKSDYEAMKRDLALSAVLLYDQYFVAARALAINAQHVALMRSLRDAVTAQFQAGRATAQDPLQAEAELAHLEHDTAILAVQRAVTVAQMNELLHRAPELPLPPPPTELALPAIPETRDAAQLENEALAERTEIAAARQRARGARARADRADRESYPDLTVSTSYNSMWDMPEHRWMVGLGFSLPIQSGRRAGAADEALALRAQFESDAAHLSDAARTQVFIAFKQLQESAHVVGLFEKRLLPIARAQIDAARAGFTASQSPFTALVTAEKDLRVMELDYQMARAECDRHRAELERAIGRIPGLDAREERP